MSANQSQLLLGGMVLCLSEPEARRGSSDGPPEDRGALSVELVLSCGVVIGYLRRRALASFYSNKHTQPPGGWPWTLMRWRTTVGSARGSSTTWLRSKRLVSRNFWRVRSVVTATISVPAASAALTPAGESSIAKIGRASCRERV